MFDVSVFDDVRIANALLREDHDLLTEDQLDNDWTQGEVSEVMTEHRDASRWEIVVSYQATNTDQNSAFPCGRIEASDNVTPDEPDTYKVAMVILFDELVIGHHVILEADHSGSPESDETHSARTCGTITVVPASEGPAALAAALGRQRRDVMGDIRSEIDKISQKLEGASLADLRAYRVTDAFGQLARLMARAA